MTHQLVEFPDVEQLAIDYLLGMDNTVPITSRTPNPRPDRFVTVRRGGGPATLVTDQPLLIVECWGPNDADGIAAAHDLAQQIRARLRAMRHRSVGGVPVYRVDEVAGPQVLPDESEQPRVTFTVSVLLRGSPQ